MTFKTKTTTKITKRTVIAATSRTRIILPLKDVITFERNIIISKDYI